MECALCSIPTLHPWQSRIKRSMRLLILDVPKALREQGLQGEGSRQDKVPRSLAGAPVPRPLACG